MSPSTTRVYTVTGMTCEHCVRTVVDEVSEIPGVSAVDVDLDTGRTEVVGEDLHDDAIRVAVAEAGYSVA